MKALLRFVMAVLLFAIVAHAVTLLLVPTLGMNKVFDDATRHEQWNTITHGEPVDAYHQAVVTSSPDMAYSLCRYDLSAEPTHVFSKPPPGYWSWSFYDDKGHHFATLNATALISDAPNVLLLGPGQQLLSVLQDQQIVASPSIRGVAVLRIALAKLPSREAVANWQAQAGCEPWDAVPPTPVQSAPASSSPESPATQPTPDNLTDEERAASPAPDDGSTP